jgi:iron complex transport system substrate-binding protein
MIKRCAALLLSAFAFAATMGPLCAQTLDQGSNARPRHIVSFNLCADQLLLTLADRDQIAGLSPYALDPSLSVTTAKAAGIPRLDWEAESVVNLKPDLVLIGPRSGTTRAMLEKFGVRIADVSLVTDLAGAQAQAREIGRLVGHPERGEQLAAELARAEAVLVAAALKTPRTALVVERGGYTEGSQTLIAAMLTAAGLRPPDSSPAGLGGFLSLEQLLIDAPDILVLKDPPVDAADQGALFITHPALRAKYPASRRIDLPARTTLCGGPALRDGLELLAGRIRELK